MSPSQILKTRFVEFIHGFNYDYYGQKNNKTVIRFNFLLRRVYCVGLDFGKRFLRNLVT